jgi:hypothetical protein
VATASPLQAARIQRPDEAAEEFAEGAVGGPVIVKNEIIRVATALNRPHQQLSRRATFVKPVVDFGSPPQRIG